MPETGAERGRFGDRVPIQGLSMLSSSQAEGPSLLSARGVHGGSSCEGGEGG